MAENTLKLRIITPDEEFYNDEVERVVVKTTEGDIGVVVDHTPITAALKSGVCIITKDGKDVRGFIHGGFTEVTGDGMILLPDAAEWPEEIDIERAKQAKKRAEERLKASDDSVNKERATKALERAVTRLQVMEWYDGHN